MGDPAVTVVIPNWNGEGFLRDCLPSLERQTFPDFEVYVIDNDSSDGSVAYVERHHPDVKILKNKENLEFAKCNNQIMGRTEASYLLFLNNDTMASDDLLEVLLRLAKRDEGIGVCGCKVLNMGPKDSLQQVYLTCDLLGFPVEQAQVADMESRSLQSSHRPRGPRGSVAELGSLQTQPSSLEADPAGLPSRRPVRERLSRLTVRRTFYVSGCCLMIKRSLFEELGGFDETYAFFAEDLDLCWRVWLRGYKVMVTPHTFIYHYGGGSEMGGVARGSAYETTHNRVYLRERNTLRTLMKNYETGTLVFLLPLQVLISTAEMMFFGIIGQPEVARQYLKGYISNLKDIRDILGKRRIVQRSRWVSDRFIFRLLFRGYGKLNSLKKVGLPSFVDRP